MEVREQFCSGILGRPSVLTTRLQFPVGRSEKIMPLHREAVASTRSLVRSIPESRHVLSSHA